MIENDLVESINTEKNTILDFKRILRTLSPLYVAILITYVAILGYVNLLYVSLLELEKIELLTFPIGVLIGAFTLCIAAIIGGKLKKKYLYLTITIVVFIQHILMFFTLFYIKFHMTLMARDYFLKFPVLIEVASNLGYNVPRILTATLVSITISFLLHYELANSSKTILTTNMRKLLLSILLIFSIIVTVIYSQVSYSIKREITSNRAVLATYNELYKNELEKNQEGSLSNDINLEDIRNNKENVFFIQLESLNTELVNNIYTPEMLALIAKNGILLRNYQASVVNTTPNQEVFLCGILPPFYKTTATSNTDSTRLNCLPKILKDAGYKTVYMQLYDTEFGNMKEFLHNIGFDEVVGLELFHQEDPLLKWGYSDEIAYKRFFEYLETNHSTDEKLFVHIAVGSINHYPFDSYSNSLYANHFDKLPNKTVDSSNKAMENTAYLQDKFMGTALKEYFFEKYSKSSHLFVFGDHAFPLQQHKKNYFNTFFAYQENFVTALVYVPPEKFANYIDVGKSKTDLISNRLLPRTVLELLSYSANDQNLKQTNKSKGFTPVLLSKGLLPKDYVYNKCVLSVQPFSGRYVTVTNYPQKYIFHQLDNKVEEFDLSNDPYEDNGIHLGEDVLNNASEIISNCVNHE